MAFFLCFSFFVVSVIVISFYFVVFLSGASYLSYNYLFLEFGLYFFSVLFKTFLVFKFMC